MARALRLAGLYNLAWGALTVLWPAWFFRLTGLDIPSHPFIWQCLGMVIGVYGLGYWWAASDPARHWPIVAVGMLGKIFGPLGYLGGLLAEPLAQAGLTAPFLHPVPPAFGFALITNDLLWWAPFTLILLHALRVNTRGEEAAPTNPRDAMANTIARSGRSVLDLSNDAPLLLVFLRHTGCTFCREAIADVAAAAPALKAAGVRPLFVHMSPPDEFDRLLAAKGPKDADHASDPARLLYRSFDLQRGSLAQLLGPRVWLRGLIATLRGHPVGRLVGDGFQLPGTFLVHRGRVLAAHPARTAADRPDYSAIAACALSA